MTSLTSKDGTNLFLADAAGEGGLMSNAARATFPSVVPFARWQRARDRTCAALLAGETRLLLTAPAGMGKTSLLHEVARILQYAGWQAIVESAGAQPSKRALLGGPRTALLLDDVDRISEADLAALSAAHPGAMVLAGPDGIGKGFMTAPRISLAPLDAAEARAYVSQWLALAGQHPARFQDGAIPHLIELAGGVPRFLFSLLSASTWLADAAGAELVTLQEVDRAMVFRACFLEGEEETPSVSNPAKQVREAAAPLPTDLPEARLHPVPAASEWEVADLIANAAARPPRRLLVPALAGLALLAAVGAGAMYHATWQSEIAAYLSDAQPQAGVSPAEPPAPSSAESLPVVPAGLATSNPGEPTAIGSGTAAALGSAAPAGPPAPEPSTVHPADSSAVAMASPPPVPAVSAAPVPARLPEPAAEPAVEPVRLQTEPPAPTALSNDASPPPTATEESPSPPAPAAANAERTPAPNPQPSVEQAVARLPPALVEMLVRRGNEMLALGDLSAARLLFGRAAQAGDVGAMLALGGTYDPASSTDPQPRAEDLATAARWYRLAAASGSAEAASRLQQINQHATK